VCGSTTHCLYHRGKLKQPFGTHVQDCVWQAWRLDFFAVQAMQRPIHYRWASSPHINNVNPTSMAM
jgi:hypothetical protein